MSTPLTDASTNLIRQVHPRQLGEDGEPTRTAFTPSSRDEGLLSTMHGRVSPEEAYVRHVDAGLLSAGSWHFSVGEVKKAELRAKEDGKDIGVEDHVSVDFTEVPERPRSRREQAARKLRDAAVSHACQYKPI